jgi:ankyrin repeat protein
VEKAPAILLAAMSADTPFSAEFLLKHGFNSSVQDAKSLTLAHWSAQRGYVGVLQTLLDVKGDLFFTDPNGAIAVYFAKKYQQNEAFDWLLHHGCKEEELTQQQKDRVNPKPPIRSSFEGNRSARNSLDNPRRRSQEFETQPVDQGLQSLIDRTLEDQ